MHPAHPAAVALGQIVVDGDDVHALAGQARSDRPAKRRPRVLPSPVRISVILALMQNHAAAQLHIKGALTQTPARRLRARWQRLRAADRRVFRL